MKRTLTAWILTLAMLAGLVCELQFSTGTAEAATTLTGYTATEIVSMMGRGWNLGNTFDSTGGTSVDNFETNWGNPKVTETLIKGVKNAGFNTIRIPVTWYRAMSSDGTYTISSEYLARIKTVVDWCYKYNMFVILDVHHEAWINNTSLRSNWKSISTELQAVWKQLASYFGDYDQHLIFEGMNEPRYAGADNEWTGDDAGYKIVNYYSQMFVSTVRSSTKGHNYERCLMVPGYAASNSSTVLKSISIPTYGGKAADNIIISVHCYSPYDFCLADTKTTFSASSSSDTADIDRVFQVINDEFLSQGIPVIIGECSATNSGGNTSARAAWAKYMGAKSAAYGVPIVFWDNGNNATSGGEAHSYINRTTGAQVFPSIITAFDTGYKSVTYGSARTSGTAATSLIGMNTIWQNKSGVAIKQAWSASYVSIASDPSYYPSSGTISVAYKGSGAMYLIFDSESQSQWWGQVSPDSTTTVNGYKVATFKVSSILSVLKSLSPAITAVSQIRNIYPISSGTGNTVYEVAYNSTKYQVTFKALGLQYATGTTLPADPASYGALTFAGWYTTKDYQEGTELDISNLTENVTAYAKYVNGTKTITLTPTSAEIPINSTKAFSAAATGNSAITWSSSNSAVATVNSNGTVTAVSYGKANIIARSASGLTAYTTVQTRFSDVAGSADRTSSDYQYYFTPVYWAADNGITAGMGDGTFGVGLECTRKDVMLFIWRMAGKPSPSGDATDYFTDVSELSTSFNKAIAWAYENGIAKGYDNGTFGIELPIARKDVLIMLYRYAGKPSVGTSTMKFTDCTGYASSSDTYKAIIWGTNKGITAGYADGTFKPLENCLREQIITFLYRYGK